MSSPYLSYPGASREAPHWDHDLNEDHRGPDSAELDDCSGDFMGTSDPPVQVLAAPTADIFYQNSYNNPLDEGENLPQHDNFASVIGYYALNKEASLISKAQRPDTRVWRRSLPDRTRASTNVGFRRRSRGSWNLAPTQRAPHKGTQNSASEATGMKGPRAPAAPPPPPLPESTSSCTATAQADYRNSSTSEYYNPNNGRPYSAHDLSHAWGQRAAGLLSSPLDIPKDTNPRTTEYQYSFDSNLEATLPTSALDPFSFSGTAVTDFLPLDDPSLVDDNGCDPEPQIDTLSGSSCEDDHPFYPCSTIHNDSQQSTAYSYNIPTISNQYHTNDLARIRQAQEHSLPQEVRKKSSANDPLVAQCTNCGKTFTGYYCRRNLIRHEQLEHSDGEHPKYPCCKLGCTRAYKRSDARRVHQRRAHPEMTLAPEKPRKRKSTEQ